MNEPLKPSPEAWVLGFQTLILTFGMTGGWQAWISRVLHVDKQIEMPGASTTTGGVDFLFKAEIIKKSRHH